MTPFSSNGLNSLSEGDKDRYLLAFRHMTNLVRDYTIPIAFAPPLKTFAVSINPSTICTFTLPLTLGKIDGASACIVQLDSGVFVITAEHVLHEYEVRVAQGEVLNWQIGALPPLNPLERIAWRGSCKGIPKDIVFLRISEEEAIQACSGRTRILRPPSPWPHVIPEIDDHILPAGYPKSLREIGQ